MEYPSFLEFLEGSFLFEQKHVDTTYQAISEEAFSKEVFLYLNSQIHAANLLAASPRSLIRTRLERNRHEEKHVAALKNLALYVDQVLVNDALYEELVSQCPPEEVNLFKKSRLSNALAAETGEGSPFKEKVARNSKRILKRKLAYTSGFLKPIPFARIQSDPPMQAVFPQELLDWAESQAVVHSLRFEEDRITMTGRGVTEEAEGLEVGFEGYEGMIFKLHGIMRRDFQAGPEGVRLQFNPVSARELLLKALPGYIKADAQEVLERLALDYEVSLWLKATYIANNPFTAGFLDRCLGDAPHSIPETTSKIVMNLELPNVAALQLDTLLEARQKDGEAFKNFRVELEARLREFAGIQDASALQRKVTNVSHELHEVQLLKIRNTVASLHRNFLGDAAVNVVSLGIAWLTGGWGWAAPAVTAARMAKNLNDHQAKVRENPCYFLWKMSPEGQAYRLV